MADSEDPLVLSQEQAGGTLVERTTRLIRLLHLLRHDALTLHHTLTGRMGDLPPSLLRSITWDQGTEMARHTDITADLGTVPIYFCDPHAPWQRGSNENASLDEGLPLLAQAAVCGSVPALGGCTSGSHLGPPT